MIEKKICIKRKKKLNKEKRKKSEYEEKLVFQIRTQKKRKLVFRSIPKKK
jgi:hypothetical protein